MRGTFQFLENAVLAFDKSSVVKEYKEKIEKLQKEKEQLAKKLGETIVEKEWLEGKLKLHKNLNFYGTCL